MTPSNPAIAPSAKTETPAVRAATLRAELTTLEEAIAKCSHEWAAPVRATRPAYDYIFDRYEGHGSDPEPIYTVIPKTEYGYERTCAKCGFTQYTPKTKPVIVGTAPDFG